MKRDTFQEPHRPRERHAPHSETFYSRCVSCLFPCIPCVPWFNHLVLGRTSRLCERHISRHQYTTLAKGIPSFSHLGSPALKGFSIAVEDRLLNGERSQTQAPEPPHEPTHHDLVVHDLVILGSSLPRKPSAGNEILKLIPHDHEVHNHGGGTPRGLGCLARFAALPAGGRGVQPLQGWASVSVSQGALLRRDPGL